MSADVRKGPSILCLRAGVYNRPRTRQRQRDPTPARSSAADKGGDKVPGQPRPTPTPFRVIQRTAPAHFRTDGGLVIRFTDAVT